MKKALYILSAFLICLIAISFATGHEVWTYAPFLNIGGDLTVDGTTIAAGDTVGHWTKTGSDVYYNDGNVGIGTSSPNSFLHISKVQAGEGIYDGIRLQSSTSTSDDGVAIRFTTSTSSTYNMFGIIGQRDPDRLRITADNDGTEVMTMLKTGEVGIGTSSPGVLLDAYKAGANAAQMRFQSQSGNAGMLVAADTDGQVPIFGLGDYDNGDVTISNYVGGVLLDRASSIITNGGGQNVTCLVTRSATDITIAPNLTAAATFKSGGNVGIGTTVPIATLDVNGGQSEKNTFVNAATYTVSVDDRCVDINHTQTAAVTITLPAASTAYNETDSTGMRFRLSDVGNNAGTNNITINRAGTDTIMVAGTGTGETSASITGNGDSVWIRAISDSWWTIE